MLDYDAWGNLKSKCERQPSDAALQLRCRQPAGGCQDKQPTRHGALRTSTTTRWVGASARPSQDVEPSGVVTLAQARSRRFVWQGLRMVQELRESSLSSYVYSPDSPYTPMARVDAYTGP